MVNLEEILAFIKTHKGEELILEPNQAMRLRVGKSCKKLKNSQLPLKDLKALFQPLLPENQKNFLDKKGSQTLFFKHKEDKLKLVLFQNDSKSLLRLSFWKQKLTKWVDLNLHFGLEPLIEDLNQGLVLLSSPQQGGKSSTLQAIGSEHESSEKEVLYFSDTLKSDEENKSWWPMDSIYDFQDLIKENPYAVIIMDEVKDKEWALEALRASSKGHLVFVGLSELGVILSYHLFKNWVSGYELSFETNLRALVSQTILLRKNKNSNSNRDPLVQEFFIFSSDVKDAHKNLSEYFSEQNPSQIWHPFEEDLREQIERGDVSVALSKEFSAERLNWLKSYDTSLSSGDSAVFESDPLVEEIAEEVEEIAKEQEENLDLNLSFLNHKSTAHKKKEESLPEEKPYENQENEIPSPVEMQSEKPELKMNFPEGLQKEEPKREELQTKPPEVEGNLSFDKQEDSLERNLMSEEVDEKQNNEKEEDFSEQQDPLEGVLFEGPEGDDDIDLDLGVSFGNSSEEKPPELENFQLGPLAKEKQNLDSIKSFEKEPSFENTQSRKINSADELKKFIAAKNKASESKPQNKQADSVNSQVKKNHVDPAPIPSSVQKNHDLNQKQTSLDLKNNHKSNLQEKNLQVDLDNKNIQNQKKSLDPENKTSANESQKQGLNDPSGDVVFFDKSKKPIPKPSKSVTADKSNPLEKIGVSKENVKNVFSKLFKKSGS